MKSGPQESNKIMSELKSNNKWIHIPFEFVAASAIFWNASKYDEIAWIAALKREKRQKTINMRDIVMHIKLVFFFSPPSKLHLSQNLYFL